MSTTRTTLDDWVFPADEADEDQEDTEPDEPECRHMRDYVVDGECFRCKNNLKQTDEERQAESDLVGGFEPRRLR